MLKDHFSFVPLTLIGICFHVNTRTCDSRSILSPPGRARWSGFKDRHAGRSSSCRNGRGSRANYPPRFDWSVTVVALCTKIGIQASSVQAACEWANQGSDSENVARRRRVVVQRIVNFCRNAFERVFVRSLAEVPGTKVLPGDTQQYMAEPSEAQHSPSGSGETQLSPAESGEILQVPAEPGEAQQSGEPQQSPAEPGDDQQSPAELDEETDAEHPTKRKGMTLKEANEKAMGIAAHGCRLLQAF